MNEGAKGDIPNKTLDTKVLTYLSAHLIFRSENYKNLRGIFLYHDRRK